ncbi:hypothetical protein Tco_1470532, partial [Tanacetum coccineum]
GNTYLWNDHGLEEDKRQENGLDIEDYDPLRIGGHFTIRKGKRIKVQRNDPERIGRRRKGPKADVEWLKFSQLEDGIRGHIDSCFVVNWLLNAAKLRRSPRNYGVVIMVTA